MFIVEYESGFISERETTWDKLPDDKPIISALLCNQGIIVGLVGQDEYWFSNQAIATLGEQYGTLVAQILGGKKDGKSIEIIQQIEDGKSETYIFTPEVPINNVYLKSRRSIFPYSLFERFNGFFITRDHKPGRINNATSKGCLKTLARIFRGFK